MLLYTVSFDYCVTTIIIVIRYKMTGKRKRKLASVLEQHLVKCELRSIVATKGVAEKLERTAILAQDPTTYSRGLQCS